MKEDCKQEKTINTPIYCIPGLSVDKRIFQSLSLAYPQIFVDWIEPASEESLFDYAQRMSTSIPKDQPIILLGLSFGGIIAQILTQTHLVERLILISTIKSHKEKPLNFRILTYLPLYQLSRGKWRIQTLPYWAPQFGIHEPEDIKLLQDMFAGFSDRYRMWAIRQICHWKGIALKVPFLHIHGENDRVFPPARIKDYHLIKGGNHYMIKQKAKELSEVISAWLKKEADES